MPLIVAERRNPAYPVKSGCALLSRNIATMTIHGPADENAANAKLIAAAPELLEACELVLRNLAPAYSSSHLCIVKLVSAIANAKGEL